MIVSRFETWYVELSLNNNRMIRGFQNNESASAEQCQLIINMSWQLNEYFAYNLSTIGMSLLFLKRGK